MENDADSPQTAQFKIVEPQPIAAQPMTRPPEPASNREQVAWVLFGFSFVLMLAFAYLWATVKPERVEVVKEVQILKPPPPETPKEHVTKKLSIFDAAAAGDIQQVKANLDADVNANSRNVLQETPLHSAAAHDNLPIMELLLSKGADIDATDKWNRTPLNDAVYLLRTNAVKFLLERGAYVNREAKPVSVFDNADLQSHEKTAPMFAFAFDGGDKYKTNTERTNDAAVADIIEILLEHGASPDCAWGFSNETLLCHAVESNNYPLVDLLIEKKVRIDAECHRPKGISTNALLLAATDKAHWAENNLINKLVKFGGADVNYVFIDADNGFRESLLQRAIKEHPAEIIISNLLECGARLDFKNSSGQTALHTAAGANDPENIDILLEKGADANAVDNDGRTPLDVYIETFNESPVIASLREKGGVTRKYTNFQQPSKPASNIKSGR